MKPRVMLINNQDSFTWNLAQLLQQSGLCSFMVFDHDKVIPENVKSFDKVIFSPGPGIPSEKPLMQALLEAFAGSKSFLGICLGHQAIAEAFGGELMNLNRVVHGIQQEIQVVALDEPLFRGIPGKFKAGLYHSWAVNRENLPTALRITSVNQQGIIMSLTHSTFDIRGVQFHPESYMTCLGHQIINNWLLM